MQPKKPILIALMGPTASGKTELAIEIAKVIKSNIQNVDSRQIYIDTRKNVFREIFEVRIEFPLTHFRSSTSDRSRVRSKTSAMS